MIKIYKIYEKLISSKNDVYFETLNDITTVVTYR